MRPNWFIAFPIDGAFVSGLPSPPPAFRSFVAEDIHLTLSWLGGCAPRTAEHAFALLDDHLASQPRLILRASLGEVVPMGGSARGYSALSALLASGLSEVEQVIEEMGPVPLDALKGPRSRRPPMPHVTLARPSRRATGAQRDAGLAWAQALDLGSVRITLDRVALYTWSQKRRERLFRIVAERALGGST